METPENRQARTEGISADGDLIVGHRLHGIWHIPRAAVAALLGVALLIGGDLEYSLGALSFYALLVAGTTIALTALTAFELLQGSSERGGSYGLAAETVGGATSFLTGWMVVSSYVMLAATLLRSAGVIVAELTSFPFSPTYLSLLLLVLLSLIRLYFGNWRHRVGETLISAAAFGFVSLLLGVILSEVWSLPLVSPSLDAGDLWQEAGRLAVVYLAVESALSSRRQIRRNRIPVIKSTVAALLSGLVLLSLPLIVLAGLPDGAAPLWRLVTRATEIPGLLAVALELAIFLLSTQVLISGALHNLREMSRRGNLPLDLRRLSPKFRSPPTLILVGGVGLGAAVVLGYELPMLDIAAGMLLLTSLAINVVGIYSRKAEPRRRRSTVLPLYPLIPALAGGMAVSLLLNLHPLGQLGTLAWVAVGLLVYFGYARRHQAAAREGISRFTASHRRELRSGRYRILLPLAPGERPRFPLQMAIAFARQLGGEVLPLQVIPVPDPLAMEEARYEARSLNSGFEWSVRQARQAGVDVRPSTRLSRSIADGIVDTATEEDCDLLLLPWAVDPHQGSSQLGEILNKVVSLSPCDTAVLAYHSTDLDLDENPDRSQGGSDYELGTIHVPTAGGPHSPLAIGLAMVLARQFGARVKATYITENGSTHGDPDMGSAHFEALVDQILGKVAQVLNGEPGKAGPDDPNIESQVIRADNVHAGILAASQHADITLIGASQGSMLDPSILGTMPVRLAISSATPVVMVRRFRGHPRLWLQRIWNSLSSALPTLSVAEQTDAYERVKRGARPNVDFFVMMGLSATIGTIGLLLNSGAVIIGAMLVAPLLTPFLAFSLAISTGDLGLVRLAVESSLKGIFVAVGLGLSIAALAPFPVDPVNLPEIASRTQPNLLDLGVALAAGAAGAYAIGRREVATALPGVAIAAALVPPLAAVGISLASGHFDRAGGAALLVLTNLIAISMAGSIILLLLGFRPAPQRESKAHFRTGLAATVVLLLIVTIPLGTVLVRSIRQSTLERTVASTLQRRFEGIESARVIEVDVTPGDGVMQVEATVHLTSTVLEVRRLELVNALESQTGRDVELSLLLIPLLELDNAETDDGQMFDWRNRPE